MDVEELMILLQRRCNAMRDIKRITGELLEASSRNDQVSLGLLLQMRAEEMAKAEVCWEQIWLMAEQGQKEAKLVRHLMSREFLEDGQKKSAEEQKIYEIRHKTASLLLEVLEADQRLNRNIGGDRSYYVSNKK